jgi:hypothetical protein
MNIQTDLARFVVEEKHAYYLFTVKNNLATLKKRYPTPLADR